MREFSIEEDLKKNLSKISKKDKILYNAIMKKIEEILTCEDVNHYKNLKKPLQDFKRVHVKSSFVLTFKYIESEDKVVFYRLKHHDDIYQ
ncbi:MAG TPA: addiction module toxin RelE [Candidatus Woesearchaeota archaeon]|jgi:YafQ family addiction module toxin component|nr:addiction module toxin RelE [Candidatus Woesearchaeota archaeon]